MKKRLRRIFRLTIGRKLWTGLEEIAGYGLLVFAAWTVYEVAGFALAGLVLLNYAYSGIGRSR